ncbi:MAG: BrnA antitoxin family protein [Gallionellaceae bacterium]|nr:BrnA antitoxin family protein [Gallionellaceae bacterium]
MKSRLKKDRPMTSVTVRIPADVIESMKAIAPLRGFSGYQTLLKAYLSDGLRRDEAQFGAPAHDRLIAALKRHGVPENVIEQAEREAQAIPV